MENWSFWRYLDQKFSPLVATKISIAAWEVQWEDDVYHVAVDRGMLPDPARVSSLTWSEVKATCPPTESENVVKKVDPDRVRSMLQKRNKKEFEDESEELWPYRTKTDKVLRRTRLLDYVLAFRTAKRSGELESVLLASREGWDLIFVTNLCAATFVFGWDWFARWQWLGAFEQGLELFVSIAKHVHNVAKASGLRDKNWIHFVECANLVGYRNPPFPGFDMMKEARALADGGEEHNLFGRPWSLLVQKYLPMSYHQVDYRSFDEFVESGDWLTTGASSVGKLEVLLPDGKVKKIKARKNMVADVVDLKQLAADALAAHEQKNSTIVKSELGKLRLAVAGDIYTYLKMTWINELLGGSYYDWPGNTSEESFQQQTERLYKMLQLCSTHLGLPYDYAGFDHQPTRTELVGIMNHLIEHARLNVPSGNMAEFDAIAKNVVDGFYNATLFTKDGDKELTLPVNGGLMSGLRWTSVLGNGWNSVMTGLCLELLTSWGMPINDIERFIRGDDSAIYVKNWAIGAGMNVAYDAIGAKAGVGKFALRKQGMEFLRVWFDRQCRGYPARAIPGLTQRKPWSSNPWSEDMVIKAVFETTRILRRRLSDRVTEIDQLWATLRTVWCQNHRLPNGVTMAGIYDGGFGIEPPPQGKFVQIRPPVPRADPVETVSILNQNNWRQHKFEEYVYARYGMVIDGSKVAREELLATVTADNVPDVAVEIRQKWLLRVRSEGCRAYTHNTGHATLAPLLNLNVFPPDKIGYLMDLLKVDAPLFGCAPEVKTAKMDYSRIRPKMSFRKWVSIYFPRVYIAMRKFHRSWHRSEILDYIGGSITLAPSTIHPALVKVVAWLTAGLLRPGAKAQRHLTLGLGGSVEQIVLHSPLSQLVYMW